MTKKTLGYVELEWSCPNCGNKNPGMKKTCTACGSPQPASTQFELGQKQDMIADAQKAAEAAKGANIHCPYCNTRNLADALTCIQCGGDLTEGLKREKGRVLSGSPLPASDELKCPGCGALNQAGSSVCSACGISLSAPQIPSKTATQVPGTKSATFRPWMAIPIIGILAAICVIFGLLFVRTTSQTGVVQGVQWQRTITIEAQREVIRETWRDQVPAGVEVLSCRQEYRSRQDNPAPNAKEVCATALIDQGNGSAKVEETCYYEVYDDYCKYPSMEWQKVDDLLAQGADSQPYWPQENLMNGQRAGERSESFRVDFETKDGIKQFTTNDAALFAQLQPGTQWTLSVNTLGAIIDVSP